MFRDRTVPAGLAPAGSRGTGFGTVMADFDHDGALDVAVVNGRVGRGTAGRRGGPGAVLESVRRAEPAVRQRRGRPVPGRLLPGPGPVRRARGLPRPGLRGRRRRRGPRPARHLAGRPGAAVPQRRPRPGPRAARPGHRPGPPAGRLRRRGHGPGRRPPLGAVGQPGLQLPVQQRPAGPLRAGPGRSRGRHRRPLAGRDAGKPSPAAPRTSGRNSCCARERAGPSAESDQ